MTRKAIWILAVAVLAVAFTHPAEAKRHHKAPRHGTQAVAHCTYDNSPVVVCRETENRTSERLIARDANGNRADPRPTAWCGWQMRQWLGVADRAFNLARRWARYGSAAHGPAIGTVVVWPHHVGLVTAKTADGWVVKSGNDGHAVRERVRSLKGAIAFRWPPQRFAGL